MKGHRKSRCGDRKKRKGNPRGLVLNCELKDWHKTGRDWSSSTPLTAHSTILLDLEVRPEIPRREGRGTELRLPSETAEWWRCPPSGWLAAGCRRSSHIPHFLPVLPLHPSNLSVLLLSPDPLSFISLAPRSQIRLVFSSSLDLRDKPHQFWCQIHWLSFLTTTQLRLIS